MHRYTEAQTNFIRENIKGIKTDELTEMFNQHFNTDLGNNQIRGFITRHGFKSGVNCQFKKSHIPFNKGKTGLCARGCEKTWFKKGNTPTNHKAIGSERVNTDGYTEVKVAEPNKWRLKHQIVWEEHNGPIPKSYAVIFGDGNKNNLDIDNLILVSRKKLLVMNKNKLIKENVDLTITGTIIADVLIKISERKK